MRETDRYAYTTAYGFRVDELLSFIIDRFFFFFTQMSDYSDFTSYEEKFILRLAPRVFYHRSISDD